MLSEFVMVFLLLLGVFFIIVLLIRVAMLSSQVQQLQNFIGNTVTFTDMSNYVENVMVKQNEAAHAAILPSPSE